MSGCPVHVIESLTSGRDESLQLLQREPAEERDQLDERRQNDRLNLRQLHRRQSHRVVGTGSQIWVARLCGFLSTQPIIRNLCEVLILTGGEAGPRQDVQSPADQA